MTILPILKRFFTGPFVERVLVPFISIPILALLTFYFLSFFGFRMDGVSIYGVSAERRPELSYSYDEKIDGFKISWRPNVDFEQLDWKLKVGNKEYNVKTYNDKDPFVIYKNDITRILLSHSINIIMKDLGKFSKDGNYSKNELEGGIECEVLPKLSKQGIPVAAKIRYQNRGSNETHEILDAMWLKGLGGNSPRASIDRNISKDSYDNFLDEGGVFIEDALLSITIARSKYKNDTDECLERYILEYRID